MKKVHPFFGFLIGLIVFGSCLKDETNELTTADRILNGKEFVVHDGILTFKNSEIFQKITNDLLNKNGEELTAWERQIGFTSLRTVHEEIIEKEEQYLNQKAEQYPGNATLTRKDLGYTEFTTRWLNSGLFFTNEFETIDMNITSPIFGAVVNKSGVFRIGDEIIMPQRDYVKIIKDGDPNKIGLLNSIIVSDKTTNIEVVNVKRDIHRKTSNGRVQAWTSCTSTNGSYRLIVYEESSAPSLPIETPCDYVPNSYWLTFRSLKKILGTWQNHQTGEWYVVSSVKVDHYKYCDQSNTPGPAQPIVSLLRNVVDITDQRYDLPFGHTATKYFFNGYDTGPCASGGLNTCPANSSSGGPNENPFGVLDFVTRSHQGYGKNGTTCYVGQ
jgi:hypothetical protein